MIKKIGRPYAENVILARKEMSKVTSDKLVIHYDDAMKIFGISKPTYHILIRELIKKNIINKEKKPSRFYYK